MSLFRKNFRRNEEKFDKLGDIKQLRKINLKLLLAGQQKEAKENNIKIVKYHAVPQTLTNQVSKKRLYNSKFSQNYLSNIHPMTPNNARLPKISLSNSKSEKYYVPKPLKPVSEVISEKIIKLEYNFNKIGKITDRNIRLGDEAQKVLERQKIFFGLGQCNQCISSRMYKKNLFKLYQRMVNVKEE